MSKAKELLDLHKKICNSSRILPESEGLYLKYIGLSEAEEEELLSLILDEYNIEKDMGIYDEPIPMLCYIAVFCSGHSLSKVYPVLIENKIFYHAEMYIKAGEKEAKLLIQELKADATQSYPSDRILQCLSFIECEYVKDFFLESRKSNGSEWAEKLYSTPMGCTVSGGWIVDKNNQIKRLYSDKITVFKRSEGKISSLKAPLKFIEEHCPYCGNKLALIYNVDYEMTTCAFCACYQEIYTKIDENGKAHWHEKNSKSDLLKHILQGNTDMSPFDYKLEECDEKRLPSYTVHEYVDISRSQIGGMPSLIDDDYSVCPDCMEVMSFVAQIDMNDVDEYGAGMYYFFYCKDCKVITSKYHL